MTPQEIHQIVEKQKYFYSKGKTQTSDFRIRALKRLQKAIKECESEIHAALKMDLGKSAFEGYMCETGMVLSELSYMLKHINSYNRPKFVWTPLAQFHAYSYKKPSPYGVTLIMSPWNYPFMLTIDPLIDAIAAGNTAVIKPSAYSPATSAIIEKIIKKCFPAHYVAVVTGGRTENNCLLEEDFDYIFFTGSQAVGKEVMKKASANLTPVTLELGGKSPCIVDATANLKLAAKRIVFGKYLNCGQTCVAPDYVLCQSTIKDELIEEIKKQIQKQFSNDPLANENYGKIINEKHFKRLLGLIDSKKVVFGGKYNEKQLRIEPTVIDHVTFDDAIMQEEIFGPLMPILTFESIEDVIKKVQTLPHPLALYMFSENEEAIHDVTTYCQYGGGCINDTIIHLATSEMGFGGVGASGMGSYHGKTGFDTFTHYKSIVDKKTWMDLPMRYQPYRDLYFKMIRLFLK